MGREESVIRGLKAFKKELNRSFSIEKIILFGSRARGKTHRDSDIDLMIVSPKFRGMNFFKRGAKMYDHWKMRYPVDFLCYTPEEFERLRRQITIVREALREGKEI